MLNLKDCVITRQPLGLGKPDNGARVEHTPSGCAVECRKFVTWFQNKETAISVLEALVERA